MQEYTNSNNQSYLPIILRTSLENWENQLSKILKTHNPHTFDTFSNQMAELIKIDNPGKKATELEIQNYIEGKTAGKPHSKCGVWVYYPWSNRLVHLIDEFDFVRLRTNRNRNKITHEEQTQLSSKCIGIIGLSVGQSVALTIATERICGTLKLADFDTLDLSNLNRIRSGVHNIGLNKAIITAREIAEIDPFLHVEIFTEGITDTNIHDFIGGKSPLNLLVEVCDSLPVKIKSREAARNAKIPVVMDTNDRGMIDVERFDIEPNRPLFHGLVEESLLQKAPSLPPQEILPVLMKLVSFENASNRLKSSMQEIGKTITTWPQLASSVVYGGGATCDVARRILLNDQVNSGRFYLDIEALI